MVSSVQCVVCGCVGGVWCVGEGGGGRGFDFTTTEDVVTFMSSLTHTKHMQV